MKQAAVSAAVVLAMIAFGVGAYNTVGSLRGGTTAVQRPTSSLVAVPGTIYVAQGGALYRLRDGSFKQITPDDGWTQPAGSPDGKQVVAVKQTVNSGDLFLLEGDGRVVAQLTHNDARRAERNHWAFYPRFSADGATIFYSYDPKDPFNSYRVDLAIFSRPADPASHGETEWTLPNQYTGGDTNPMPTKGALVFTRFSIDEHSVMHSQVWLQGRPGSPGVALTAAADDCAQAAVSPDAKRLAMVCRHGELRSMRLVVVPLDLVSASIGPPAAVVSGGLVASPAFSPDGQTLAYLAPASPGGPFQLWTVTLSPATGPASPRQVTQNLSLDSSSPPAWVAS